eukprot:1879410-Pleurochrysis_carterae.AAC.3
MVDALALSSCPAPAAERATQHAHAPPIRDCARGGTHPPPQQRRRAEPRQADPKTPVLQRVECMRRRSE